MGSSFAPHHHFIFDSVDHMAPYTRASNARTSSHHCWLISVRLAALAGSRSGRPSSGPLQHGCAAACFHMASIAPFSMSSTSFARSRAPLAMSYLFARGLASFLGSWILHPRWYRVRTAAYTQSLDLDHSCAPMMIPLAVQAE